MFPLHPHDPPAIGPYRLRARLGEDAYARVYLGVPDDGSSVAVKVVRPEYATDPTFRAAFARQVEGARGLSGAHVCAVRDADLNGAVPWVVVGRPLGPTLAELLRAHGPLPVDAVRPLALALAQALADLHGAGLAHGSLWPDGVLMAGHGAALADPGLERAVSDTERRAPHPAFAAPEGGASPATDVFSWAATLCYAVSGVAGPEGLSAVPLQLRGLVDACLKRDPRLRPSSSDLVSMLGGPTEPPPWSPPVRATIDAVAARQREVLAARPEAGRGGPRRRGRLLALGAGALVLVVLAAGGAVFAHDRLSDDPADAAGPEEGAESLVSEGRCLDSTAYPPPEEPPAPETTVSHLEFSGDGDVLAVTSEVGPMVWDWREGREIARPTTTGSAVFPELAFSPVGCTLVAAEPVEYEGREEPVHLAHTYDLISGETVQHLGAQEGPDDQERWLASPNDVRGFAFSPEGTRLAVTLDQGSDDGPGTNVVDTATGEAGEPLAEGLQYETRFVDEDHFVTNDYGTVHVWDAGTGEEVGTVEGTSDSSLAVRPGTTQVAYAEDPAIHVEDYEDGTEVASFTREEFESDDEPILIQLLFDPAGERLYATWSASTGPGSREYHPYVWDLESGENLVEAAEEDVSYRRIAIHPDGEVIAAVGEDGAPPALLDPDTFEQVDTLY
ncbi:protein kinase [Nocardiopsis sp. JB363]|uniref:protein kinase domain-containing protein n=1 Tax=Nocardiopsis sp. JB363 TaxID=1434837 RepID=UPI00097A4606|nr:protein kinase [Nocardiopsis sp. JB363]SIO85759.1 putative serine/threonine protein kinase [Nocardiopsis sp. JB363]